jgi:hypothetical protein
VRDGKAVEIEKIAMKVRRNRTARASRLLAAPMAPAGMAFAPSLRVRLRSPALLEEFLTPRRCRKKFHRNDSEKPSQRDVDWPEDGTSVVRRPEFQRKPLVGTSMGRRPKLKPARPLSPAFEQPGHRQDDESPPQQRSSGWFRRAKHP